MAFQPAPILATSPTEPQTATVLMTLSLPPTPVVLNSAFTPAPVASSLAPVGGSVGYAM